MPGPNRPSDTALGCACHDCGQCSRNTRVHVHTYTHDGYRSTTDTVIGDAEGHHLESVSDFLTPSQRSYYAIDP